MKEGSDIKKHAYISNKDKINLKLYGWFKGHNKYDIHLLGSLTLFKTIRNIFKKTAKWTGSVFLYIVKSFYWRVA